jgi:16S rRNA (guanine527-N7)-methyltransferase
MKICFPETRITLIESHQKKAVFLREVIRALAFTGIDVFGGRAEDFPAHSADLVTLRAVERFDEALPAGAQLLRPNGRLALLIGQSQVSRVHLLLPRFHWREPIGIPLSQARLLLIGERAESGAPNQ